MKKDKLYCIRHSLAHIMAKACIDLFGPGLHTAIGPPIDTGFYYDFEFQTPIQQEDLERIEKKMREILSSEHYFIRKLHSHEEAENLFADQPYKREILADLSEDEQISSYTVADFVDLCRGPHVHSTKEIDPRSFRLLSIAGAYWRGNEKGPMLQRIYATAWHNKKELLSHLAFLEEAKKRDHRSVGKALDLFSTHPEVAGPGLVFWHPKGAFVRHMIESFWKDEHLKKGYDLLYTPHIGKKQIWETSGHLDFYREGMFSAMDIDNSPYYVKPMNCPFHILIYKSRMRSYQELPLRWAELGTVYRYERSGVLHGLLRVRGFTQDDAHIFCSPAQMQEEIEQCLRFSLFFWKSFGFKSIKAYLSTKPEKSVGDDHLWEEAIKALKQAIEKESLSLTLDEGGGAFYGPKIDLKITDALGREWQMTTIQFDFNLPEAFDLSFVDSDGQQKRPYMVHRALLGSLERFFGVIVEHYGGAFPLWLAPLQVALVPVAPPFNNYAKKISSILQEKGIRCSVMEGKDRMNAKIRQTQLQKVPYCLILGEREEASETLSYRSREGEKETGLSSEDFLEKLQQRIEKKE